MRALVIVSSVVKVFEETTKSVSAGSRSRVASAKSVPSTLETKRKRHLAAAEVAQRLVGHHRAEVGAADADVDDVADRLAGVARSTRRSGPAREVGHPVEHLVDLLDDVDPVDDERALARHPQRHVEHGAVLGDVDVLAGEHRVATLLDAALARQLAEQRPAVSSVIRFFEKSR